MAALIAGTWLTARAANRDDRSNEQDITARISELPGYADSEVDCASDECTAEVVMDRDVTAPQVVAIAKALGPVGEKLFRVRLTTGPSSPHGGGSPCCAIMSFDVGDVDATDASSLLYAASIAKVNEFELQRDEGEGDGRAAVLVVDDGSYSDVTSYAERLVGLGVSGVHVSSGKFEVDSRPDARPAAELALGARLHRRYGVVTATVWKDALVVRLRKDADVAAAREYASGQPESGGIALMDVAPLGDKVVFDGRPPSATPQVLRLIEVLRGQRAIPKVEVADNRLRISPPSYADAERIDAVLDEEHAEDYRASEIVYEASPVSVTRLPNARLQLSDLSELPVKDGWVRAITLGEQPGASADLSLGFSDGANGYEIAKALAEIQALHDDSLEVNLTWGWNEFDGPTNEASFVVGDAEIDPRVSGDNDDEIADDLERGWHDGWTA